MKIQCHFIFKNVCLLDSNVETAIIYHIIPQMLAVVATGPRLKPGVGDQDSEYQSHYLHYLLPPRCGFM